MGKNKQDIFKREITTSGFVLFKFKDENNQSCSLQESSAVEEEALIWLGVNQAIPLSKDTLSTRMHLTQSQAKQIADELSYFAKHGKLKMESESLTYEPIAKEEPVI